MIICIVWLTKPCMSGRGSSCMNSCCWGRIKSKSLDDGDPLLPILLYIPLSKDLNLTRSNVSHPDSWKWNGKNFSWMLMGSSLLNSNDQMICWCRATDVASPWKQWLLARHPSIAVEWLDEQYPSNCLYRKNSLHKKLISNNLLVLWLFGQWYHHHVLLLVYQVFSSYIQNYSLLLQLTIRVAVVVLLLRVTSVLGHQQAICWPSSMIRQHN